MKSSWSDFFNNRKKILSFFALVVLTILVAILFSKFLIWNESRIGKIFNDPILGRFRPINVSALIGVLTNGAIFLAILSLLKRPSTTIYLLVAITMMCIIRGLSIYLVVLEPPVNIIPLRDPLLELSFYQGQVLLKDLFFSGHTANIILSGLLVENVRTKRIIIFLGLVVGVLLVLQHVHYSIDVIAAPIFAILTYKLSILIGNLWIINTTGIEKRHGKIWDELGFISRAKKLSGPKT